MGINGAFRPLLRRVCLLFCSIALSAALAEISVRFVIPVPHRGFGGNAAVKEGVIHPAIEAAEDPVLVYRLKPSQEIRQLGQRVTINDRRFRDETPLFKSASGVNIALFGDSFTYGFGVADDQTIAAHLQRMIPETGRTPKHVLNFGVGGYNSAQVLRNMELRLAEFSCSATYYLYCANDSELWWQEGNPTLWECAPIFRNDGPLEGLLIRSRLIEAVLLVRPRSFLRRYGQNMEYWRMIHDPWSPGWMVTERSLAGMREVVDRNGTEFFVVFLPFQSQALIETDHRSVVGRVMEACRTLEIDFLDLSGLFAAEVDAQGVDGFWTTVGPPHFSDAGNRLVAKRLLETLKSRAVTGRAGSR